jgi:hypothetical protein
MWEAFDSETKRQLATIKEMTALRSQTPTGEWPLVFIEEHDVLLVVREWPNGALTAYTCDRRDASGGDNK